MPIWVISVLGLIVVVASFTRLSANLRPLQGVGIALGLVLIILPWVPAGKYSLWGATYEKATEARVVAATNEQFNRMAQRIQALEGRLSLQESDNATPAQRQAAQQADLRARRNYNNAAVQAAAARRRLVEDLDVDIEVAPCCESPANGQRPEGSQQGPEIDLPAMGRDDHGAPCCTAVIEPAEVKAR